MNIVVARIFGGLGNQLFCYSAARRLAVKNNAKLIIDDLSGFSKDQYGRGYQLDKFSIFSQRISMEKSPVELNAITRYFYRNSNYLLPFNKKKYLKEKNLSFDLRILDYVPRGTVYLDGYWQSENYFYDIEDIIRSDLFIEPPMDEKNKILENKIRANISIAIHIRFFNKPTDKSSLGAQINYYRNAINYCETNIPSAHYFIFSDNFLMALELIHLPSSRFTVVDNNANNPVSDMWLMSQCKHFIIANSTFSWWGAWLSVSKDKVVVAPRSNLASAVSAWGFDGLLPRAWKCL